jgi:uncharacterized protein YkwD
VRWLVAMPVAGAIVVAGIVQLVGRSGSDDGTITLTGSTRGAGQAAVKVPVAAEVTATTSGPYQVAAAPSVPAALTAPGQKRQQRPSVPVTTRPRAIPAQRSPLGGGGVPWPGGPGLPRPDKTSSTSSTTSVKTSSVRFVDSLSQASVPGPATSPSSSSGGSSNGSFVDQVVALTNAERLGKGCKALTVDATLTAVAQDHSEDMAKRNFFDHNNPDGKSPFDRMSAAGYKYGMAAENIAAGYRSPADVVKGWMNSSGHRANILNCGVTEIGVGYAAGGTHGMYWTQDFGAPMR